MEGGMSDEYTERPMTAEMVWDEDIDWERQIPYWLTQSLTAEQWEAMPEEICRRIEVVDGHVIFMQSPTQDHQGASLGLAYGVRRDARTYAKAKDLCLSTTQDYDLRIENAPLHHRRPDIIVYRCLPIRSRPTPRDTLLVIEIVSPTSRITDRIDKLAEYADAGVPHYWIVETRNGAVSTVTWYALPEDDKRYEVRACWTPAETPDGIRAEEPFPVRIGWDELAF
jgi:Uma2 family endonuclease